MRRILAPALCLLALPAAHAATFNVTRTDDPAPDGCVALDCSLREAVLAANARRGTDIIALRSATYSLSRIDTTPETRDADRGALWITESLRIEGVHRDSTRVRWNVLGRFDNPLLRSDFDATASIDLTLRNVTLSGGRGANGGCVFFYNVHGASRMTLDRARIEDCHGGNGGAMYTRYVDLTLIDAELRNNTATTSGGALQAEGWIEIDTTNTSFTGNSAGHSGGAVAFRSDAYYGPATDVVWVDDGRSFIANNHADDDGGAIALLGASSLDLSSADATPGAPRLTLTGNSADGRGGTISLSRENTFPPQTESRFERIRVLGSHAADGGGIWSELSLNVVDSEIAFNAAQTGSGGGVSFTGAQTLGRTFERVSLHHNSAYGGGGAVASECGTFSATNVSMHANIAGPTRGQAIDTLGAAQLLHVTVTDEAADGVPSLLKRYSTACASQPLRVSNSLIAGVCRSTVPGDITSGGGNQFGPDAVACPVIAGIDTRQSQDSVFGLVPGTYGGNFDVLGWAADGAARPQRNAGLASQCTALDVRGVARNDGACDAGAFEQATP